MFWSVEDWRKAFQIWWHLDRDVKETMSIPGRRPTEGNTLKVEARWAGLGKAMSTSVAGASEQVGP